LPLDYLVGVVLAAAATGYLVLALWRVSHSRFERATASSFQPPVTVLKPLCGNEAQLYECLRSFVDQDYTELQVIFGVADTKDGAIPVVRRLIAEFPDRDLALVVDGTVHGTNLKVGNLVNMVRHAKHNVIVVSDSDTRIGRDGLAQVVVPLADPATGAVTCLYKASPVGGLASRLGAMFVNDWFLSSAVVDAGMHEVTYCFGPVSALRRDALDAIGGFTALGNHLADDFMMGHLIAAAGYKVCLSHAVPHTVVCENFSSLFRHELRWARTVKAVRLGEHFMSVVTWPLPLLLVLLLPHLALGGGAILAGVMSLRIALHYALRSRFDFDSPASPWLVPLRECLCFAVWAASFCGSNIRWRHRDFVIVAGGRLLPLPTPIASSAAGLGL
jgi:ceramide glucosyltransferase